MDGRKGQGATEYLMVFGAVLLIALMAVALFGFFFGFGTDSKISESDNYWQNEARPFAVLSHTGDASNGTFYLRVENADSRETLTITDATMGGGCAGMCIPFTPTSFAPGESATIAVTDGPNGTVGNLYDAPLNITYTNSNGIPAVEYGTKNLVGRYAQS